MEREKRQWHATASKTTSYEQLDPSLVFPPFQASFCSFSIPFREKMNRRNAPCEGKPLLMEGKEVKVDIGLRKKTEEAKCWQKK